MHWSSGARLGERLAYPFASVVVHTMAILALRPSPPIQVDENASAATVVIETVEHESAPTEAEPEPEEVHPLPDPTEPQAASVEPTHELDLAPPAIDEPATPDDPTPMDLTATVLTASGSSGATMRVNGSSGPAPKRSGRSRTPARGSSSTADPPAPPPRVVALADLSRAPAPPALDAALERLYPPDARRDGRAGSAAVRALVGPDGRVRSASISSASEPAFGQACHQLVMGSTWSPPLDAAGSPVATWIRYTCQFQIDR